MQPNYFVKRLITGLFAVLTMTSLWFSTPNAIAAPTLLTTAKGAAQATEDNSKSFVDNVKGKVKDAAKSNASKVDRSTDDSAAASKAKSDAATIQKRADEDAARTKDAIDNNMGAVKKAVEGIKDAFGQ